MHLNKKYAYVTTLIISLFPIYDRVEVICRSWLSCQQVIMGTVDRCPPPDIDCQGQIIFQGHSMTFHGERKLELPSQQIPVQN